MAAARRCSICVCSRRTRCRQRPSGTRPRDQCENDIAAVPPIAPQASCKSTVAPMIPVARLGAHCRGHFAFVAFQRMGLERAAGLLRAAAQAVKQRRTSQAKQQSAGSGIPGSARPAALVEFALAPAINAPQRCPRRRGEPLGSLTAGPLRGAAPMCYDSTCSRRASARDRRRIDRRHIDRRHMEHQNQRTTHLTCYEPLALRI